MLQCTSGSARSGFTVLYWLNVRNTGCMAEDLVAGLQLPEEVILLEFSQPYLKGPNEGEFDGSLRLGWSECFIFR